MLSSLDLASTLPQLDLYACIGFPLAIRMPAGPHPDFGIYVVSKDTSSVEKIINKQMPMLCINNSVL
jgi:hypothetical protein